MATIEERAQAVHGQLELTFQCAFTHRPSCRPRLGPEMPDDPVTIVFFPSRTLEPALSSRDLGAIRALWIHAPALNTEFGEIPVHTILSYDGDPYITRDYVCVSLRTRLGQPPMRVLIHFDPEPDAGPNPNSPTHWDRLNKDEG